MTPIKVFFLEPTDRQKLSLRRYSHPRQCTVQTGWCCDASVDFGEADIAYRKWDDGYRSIASADHLKPAKDDPRWPKVCKSCAVPFEDKDEYQLFQRQIYLRLDTGERMLIEDAPPGACWDAWWIADRGKETGSGHRRGPDGRCLIVKLPDGHQWMIDSRCSNCTMPNDSEHHCWVRHGKPEDGTLHVDKNGKTCAAGAGSILTPKWHGFLHNGFLVA